MPLRPILKFPDPLLRAPAADVEAFDDDLRTLAADLLDTMRAAPGIGITAPHVGVPLRVVVIELSFADGARTFVNPMIVWSSPEMQTHPEGSVSMPGVSEEIERPARIKVRWQDLDGLSHTGEADGLLAVCLQHEIDQLDGCFWVDRLSRLKRERVVKKYEKLQRR
ncbi:peptide deformylase [Rhodoplanes roseus]|uniref:Peptide deformylase-like n=1 Tax=Rhodoplanes roseus TaxID=29409 RepID=A0A327L226_9BRAD|nr:peptide deformylase [Rhodoplanes roseus]RAI44035.1 peptide deformylase [Rhodoplanes roseus]